MTQYQQHPQNPAPQPPYSYPPQQQVVVQTASNMSPTVTIGDWLVFFILQLIPGVNLIAMIVYACDSSKPSRANFAKLQLILIILGILLGVVFFVLLGAGLAGFAAHEAW